MSRYNQLACLSFVIVFLASIVFVKFALCAGLIVSMSLSIACAILSICILGLGEYFFADDIAFLYYVLAIFLDVVLFSCSIFLVWYYDILMPLRCY